MIRVLANVDLTGKEGFLARLISASGVAKADLPSAVTQACPYVIEEGAAAGSYVTLRPLTAVRNVRIKAKGTGSAGDPAIPATTGDFGKVRANKAGLGGGSSSQVGYFEEDFVDGQLALVRHNPAPSITILT